MSLEESPLLVEATEAIPDHEKVYQRFTSAQKRIIVLIVSWGGVLPLFVSGSFVPSIPQIARELGSTGSIINLAVSLSLFSGAICSLVWATYSGYYGRRPIYLVAAPCLSIGSLGVATCGSVPTLLAWRVVQAGGASCGFSVGAGVIGDIYKLEERGTALGVFFAASLSGAAFAPVAGGLAAHYASWRAMQYVLFANGLAALIAVALFLPETSHPGARGVDKATDEPRRHRWVWLNPFRCLALLRAPTVAAITLVAITVLLTDFVLLIPLSYTIGARYNITNEALIGSFFIAAGVGNILGAPISGMVSDHIVVKWRKLRGGDWVPEDRLRGTLLPMFILVPLSILCSGLTTQFIPGRLGIILNVLCLLMNGIGVDLVLAPISAYIVDILHSKSAEAMAAHKGVRNLVVSGIIAPILPLINLIGVASTNALAAFIAWIGAFILLCTIRYGAKMRTWVDVSYSTIEDN
ncbi:hypothetical protein CERSUDRAFT_117129 [Gelatoporia subvermispora B]|uniref:Major facilitator superfamily (MFS) profile domain-containing protein n=1 Tax=Ceriporiopsis subvermispora (strain B) TaxID=914234 RepID=M2R5Q6_CERS8|nr:hypothetical protein CERSUDRAFT_117129 [Gelatoporia subvermispora B]